MTLEGRQCLRWAPAQLFSSVELMIFSARQIEEIERQTSETLISVDSELCLRDVRAFLSQVPSAGTRARSNECQNTI